jgi:AcrR family transcriptional regulator
MPRLRQNSVEGNVSSQTIKMIALRLFAERGVDGVTVREIAAAAGQKNHGAVGYYFGTKEALVREIVADGAKVIDDRRNALLDEMEASGGPTTMREMVDAIIYPSLDPFDEGERDCYMRFTVILHTTHMELFTSAIGNQWNKGYQRCLAHLRRLMPAMPAHIKNQRLLFLGSYLAMVMALRQTALSDTTRAHSTWPAAETLRHLSLTATAMLAAPEEEDALLTP